MSVRITVRWLRSNMISSVARARLRFSTSSKATNGISSKLKITTGHAPQIQKRIESSTLISANTATTIDTPRLPRLRYGAIRASKTGASAGGIQSGYQTSRQRSQRPRARD